MLDAKYVSRSTFDSKDGRTFYQMECLAKTIEGNYTTYQLYCTKTAYDAAASFADFEDIKVALGIDTLKRTVIANVKGIKGVAQ